MEHISNLSSVVLNELEKRILDGTYKTGDSLVESKISEEFGISRTPVREALRRLEAYGLVDIIQNKGAVVSEISKQEIQEIYEIRMSVEGLAARWAAEKINKAHLKKLQESLDLLEFYILKNDLNRLHAIDYDFHKIIYDACDSKPLKRILMDFYTYMERTKAGTLKDVSRFSQILSEHTAIYEAIASKNPLMAEDLSIKHIITASKYIN